MGGLIGTQGLIEKREIGVVVFHVPESQKSLGFFPALGSFSGYSVTTRASVVGASYIVRECKLGERELALALRG